MTTKESYYKQVPLSAEVEAALRAEGASDIKRKLTYSVLAMKGYRSEAGDVQRLGAMTMVGALLWVHEDKKWHCWKRFGWDGWLLIETRPEESLGKPGTFFRPHSSRYNSFSSSREQFAYEERLRQRGLKLTAKYRRDYERRVAEAERKLVKAKPKPNNNPPRPKM